MKLTPARTSASHRGLALLLIVSVLLPGSSGCALFRTPVPAFETVAIQVEVERDKKGQLEGDLEAYTTLKGTLVGIVTGVPTFAIVGGGGGFAVGALACAPSLFLYPVCVLVATVLGFLGGAVFGLFGGGIVGGIGGLPSETADQITLVLGEMEVKKAFDEDLAQAMHEAIPAERQADVANAAGIVTARLRDFDLIQHMKDKLSVRLRAAMVQSWKNKDGKQKEYTCQYVYDSERRPADVWLEGGGGAFRTAVVDGFKVLARWMNRDLEAFASKKEFDESDDAPASCFRESRWYRWF